MQDVIKIVMADLEQAKTGAPGAADGKVIRLDEVFYHQKAGLIYKFVLSEIEKPLIEKALKRTFGNQIKAAKILGISRNTLRVKVIKYGLRPEKWKI